MLETVREFAAGRLSAMPEAAHPRGPCRAVRALAKDLARPPCWPARDGLDLLELEHDNFRVALDWYRREDPSAALRLANRLTAFWSARGHFSEGRRRLGELLDLVPDDDPERVDALNGAAWLATDQGDRAPAIPLLDESIERARATHDVVREATALFYRGRAKQIIGDPAGGGSDIERALELQTDRGRRRRPRRGPVVRRLRAMFEDDLRLAIERFERCAELSEALGLPAIEARALQLLGVSRLELGDLPAPGRRSQGGCPPSSTSAIVSPSRSG